MGVGGGGVVTVSIKPMWIARSVVQEPGHTADAELGLEPMSSEAKSSTLFKGQVPPFPL